VACSPESDCEKEEEEEEEEGEKEEVEEPLRREALSRRACEGWESDIPAASSATRLPDEFRCCVDDSRGERWGEEECMGLADESFSLFSRSLSAGPALGRGPGALVLKRARAAFASDSSK